MTAESSVRFRRRRGGKAFARQERGGVLIEIAFGMVVLTTLILGTVETAFYVLMHQRLDRAASTVADIVSQPDDITQGDIADAFWAAKNLFGGMYDFDANGYAIVTSVRGGTTEDPPPRINFQINKSCTDEGPGSGPVYTSQIGTGEDEEAELPNDLTLQPGESVIIAEVFFDYQPLFSNGIVEGGTQYKTSSRRPRLSAGVLAGGSTC